MLLRPHGRRLCVNLAAEYRAEAGEPLPCRAPSFGGDGAAGAAASAAGARPGKYGRRRGRARAHGALARSVDMAMYWQEPDEEDALLADPVFAGALLPLAEAVLGTPEVAWWEQPLAADGASGGGYR